MIIYLMMAKKKQIHNITSSLSMIYLSWMVSKKKKNATIGKIIIKRKINDFPVWYEYLDINEWVFVYLLCVCVSVFVFVCNHLDPWMIAKKKKKDRKICVCVWEKHTHKHFRIYIFGLFGMCMRVWFNLNKQSIQFFFVSFLLFFLFVFFFHNCFEKIKRLNEINVSVSDKNFIDRK